MKKARNIGSDEDVNEGIWYYLWLKPLWMLFAEFGPQANHWEYWGTKAAPAIWNHYKIKGDEKRRELLTLQHSMPRGRVVEIGGQYILLHGNDFPLNKDSELDKLYSAFGLTRRLLIGQATDQFERHETMDESEKQRIQQLIGKVPY